VWDQTRDADGFGDAVELAPSKPVHPENLATGGREQQVVRAFPAISAVMAIARSFPLRGRKEPTERPRNVISSRRVAVRRL
jgi:hypothetical protein